MALSRNTLHGGTHLVFDSVAGITTTVERMHETIARHPLPWSPQPPTPGRAHGWIAAAVYATIRGSNGALRAGADQVFKLFPAGNTTEQTADEVRAIAALNGVCGDHLESTGNAAALTMSLRSGHQALEINRASLSTALPEAGPHLTIFVHGLCLSELSWRPGASDALSSRLATAGETTLYLRYNTGRHISSNGQELNQLLEAVRQEWPVPLESISLVGHSMGGLVIRSAGWYAAQSQAQWLANLRRVVCLGTPHHGSIVAKAGHLLDVAMQKIAYIAPLAFGKHRSAGIKDLQHGDLLDEDWQDHPPHEFKPDTRKPVPLLAGVEYYFVAATVGKHQHDPLGKTLGDLLVRLDSAVGSHPHEDKHLPVKRDNCRVFHEQNHFDLLYDERVHQQIVQWFESGSE